MPLPSIERHVGAADLAAALHADVREGLATAPKALPPKWLYDACGSALFERITELDAYYPTRAEWAALSEHSRAIAAATRVGALIELGSGSSEKTRLLLDALVAEGTLRRYVPVDVSDSALLEAAERVAAEYPEVEVHGIVADFEQTPAALTASPGNVSRLVAVLGGTIGNFPPDERAGFLSRLRGALSEGDALLLGTDLVKDPERLIAAYDDPQGVTAEFNRNVLHVINRELGAEFVPEDFEHVATWDSVNERIEMRLRSRREQRVWVSALGLVAYFAEGEEMRTEISAKFRRQRVEAELADAGFTPRRWWPDPAGDFALSLATPDGSGA